MRWWLPWLFVTVWVGTVAAENSAPSSPWKGGSDERVRLEAFGGLTSFESAPGQRHVEVEELDRRGDTRQLRFIMTDGAGSRAPLLAYLDVTVRTDRAGTAITLDMMQSFGRPGAGTMSDLCRAVAFYPDVQRATKFSALLDLVNDEAFREAYRKSGDGPLTAFRATETGPDGKPRAAVPLSKHLAILMNRPYAILRLEEVATGRQPRYEITVQPTGSAGGPSTASPVDCAHLTGLVP